MTLDDWFTKYLPAEFERATAGAVSYIDEYGIDDEATKALLALGTYRGVGWLRPEPECGLTGYGWEEIEFTGYPTWAKEILDNLTEKAYDDLREQLSEEAEA